MSWEDWREMLLSARRIEPRQIDVGDIWTPCPDVDWDKWKESLATFPPEREVTKGD